MWKFEKRAGMILDQQDDPGFWWEKIASFWPEDLDEPDIGIEKSEDDCLAYFSDGMNKVAKYPIDSPENTLASSMYFVSKGVEYLDKEAHIPVGKRLKDSRVAWDVEMPDGFVEFVKEAHLEKTAEQEDIFADSSQNFPITTPQQLEDSVEVFTKTAERIPAKERLVIGRKLKEASLIHGIERDVPYSQEEMSKNASFAIDRRIRVMKRMPDHSGKVSYISGLEGVKKNMNMSDYRSLLRSAEKVESLDKQANMDQGWGRHFPDPAKTFTEGIEGDPFKELEKRASYANIDFDGLKEIFEDHIVEEIKEDPEAVIPTLPGPQKKLVKDYINERKKV